MEGGGEGGGWCTGSRRCTWHQRMETHGVEVVGGASRLRLLIVRLFFLCLFLKGQYVRFYFIQLQH